MCAFVTTKGRYAVRVLIDLAEHRDDGRVPLKEIAERQGISQKYLESIMALLVKAGLVEGAHGKGGGYELCIEPRDITVGSVLRITEGGITPVACIQGGKVNCDRAPSCKTLPMWQKLDEIVNGYLDTVTIQDLTGVGLCPNVILPE